MKFIFVIAMVLASGLANASLENSQYTGTFSETADSIVLNFETKATYPAMCGLITQALEIEAPINGLGRIAFYVLLEPEGMCLTAFGPSRRSLTLPKGPYLPQIPQGEYSIEIDGDWVGNIVVNGK